MDRLLSWIQYRLNRSKWQRRLRQSPRLASCWGAVQGHPKIRGGFIDAEGRICEIDDLSEYALVERRWYAGIRDYVQQGWTEMAVFTLTYKVRKRPQDALVVRHFVSMRDHHYFGATSVWNRGY